MTHGSESPPPSPLHKLGVLGILVWVSMIAVDFFLHAGILASLYAQPSPFLLPPQAAFARIPLGYLSFIPFALILLWLVVAPRLTVARPGSLFGLKLGALFGGAEGNDQP